MRKTNQLELIKRHLDKKGHITSWEAIERYGCTRLSAKIYDLRNSGTLIKTESVTTKNRYGQTVTYAKYIKIKPIKNT